MKKIGIIILTIIAWHMIVSCRDKIFMTGGKYGGPGIKARTEFGYSNDVWSLEKIIATGNFEN